MLPRLAPAMAVPDRGGVARRGQGGMRRHRAGDTGACQGGLGGRCGPHQAGLEWAGDRRVWRPRPAPVRGACYVRSAGGGAAPLLVYRGAVWPGRATPAVPRGRRVWLPPPPAGVAVTRTPLGESSRGGAERAAGADGAPQLVYTGP